VSPVIVRSSLSVTSDLGVSAHSGKKVEVGTSTDAILPSSMSAPMERETTVLLVVARGRP
jgi:hypothetical protein